MCIIAILHSWYQSVFSFTIAVMKHHVQSHWKMQGFILLSFYIVVHYQWSQGRKGGGVWGWGGGVWAAVVEGGVMNDVSPS